MYAGQLGTQTLKTGGGMVAMSDIGLTIPMIGGIVAPERLPELGNRLPSCTPLFIDEDASTIDVFYAFEAIEAATADAEKVAVKVKKIMNNSISKVGMALMKMPATVAGTGRADAVVSVDSTNSEYDVISLPAAFGNVAMGDVLIEADKIAATGAKIRVLPNLMSFYDLEKAPYAKTIMFNGMYHYTGQIYENRISPIPQAIREYMKDHDCYFRFTKRSN